jgi:hypothetical protein
MGEQSLSVRPGDRVLIVDPSHPWYWHSGEITGAFPYEGLDWSLCLDNGQQCAVEQRQLRRLDDRRRDA